MGKSKFNYKKILSKSKKLTSFLEEYKIRNDNTFRAYRYHLISFFEYHNIKNIDSYIKDTRLMEKEEKLPYLDNMTKKIEKYWTYINYDKKNAFKGKTPYVFLSAIKTFLISQNSLELDSLWQKLKKNGHGNHTVTNLATPTKEELIKIFNQADLEAKALFMVQLTSGLRIGKITNMTFDNIDLNHKYPRIYFPSGKNKYPVKTRITPEAKKFLKQYQEQREKFIEIRRKRGAHNRENELDTNRVFAMITGNAQQIWKTMLINAGLYEQDKNTKKPKYGTHCLRRYFLSHFTDRNWGDVFAGHITPVNKAYLQYTHEKLDEEYIKNSQNLNIFTDDTEQKELLKINTKKLEEAQQKNQELEKRISTLQDKFKRLADHIYLAESPDDPKQSDDFFYKELELDEESRPVFWVIDEEEGIIKADPLRNQRLSNKYHYEILELIKLKNKKRNQKH